MKNLSLIIGTVFLVLNIIIGLLITQYSTFNMCLNSVVIILTTVLIFIARRIHLRDAYFISFVTVSLILGLVAYIIGLFSVDSIKDNWVIVVDLCLLGFEALLLSTFSFMSKKTNN